jgi:glycerol-3-phosphate responsive antiterminator
LRRGAEPAQDGAGRGQESADFRLPRVLVATDGTTQVDLPPALSSALLLRDLDLPTLVSVAMSARPPLAVDVDSVQGLNADAAAIRFVCDELGIGVVLTRRPAVAAAVAERGGLGLLHVFAFDSTGLERSLEAHPRRAGVGTMISPGAVLAHLLPGDLVRLPRPLVAYGLISTPELAVRLLTRADGVVVNAVTACHLPDELVRAAPSPRP